MNTSGTLDDLQSARPRLVSMARHLGVQTGAAARRGVDVCAPVSVDGRLGHDRRVLRDVDGRKRVQAEANPALAQRALMSLVLQFIGDVNAFGPASSSTAAGQLVRGFAVQGVLKPTDIDAGPIVTALYPIRA